jgi:hypothetical protein
MINLITLITSLTHCSSPSSSNRSDIESYFNIKNRHNNINTKVIDADTNIKAGDCDKEDLLDLE